MNTSKPMRPSPLRVAVCMALSAGAGMAVAAPLVVSEIPLFVASGNKPNVLLTVANSNSMDEDATGLAVGSAAPNSKSEIARRVAKNLILNYGGGLNMGLAAFQQSGVALSNLHSSPYDVTFDPANYDPTYTGPRVGPKRRFRQVNSSSPTEYIYYNVNLPYYSGSNDGIAFCYSSTAHAFNNGENPVGGPWDQYHCFRNKVGSSDILPTSGATELLNGWTVGAGNPVFSPTDSDLGQGITDFGRFMAWNWVSKTWFNNGSPGNGYIHVPIATVDATQANKMNTKLGTSQFVTNAPTGAAWPLQNAGLTPLEGTLFTIRDYFQGGIADAARGGNIPKPPNSCGKDFSVLLTNGLPSVTRFGVPSSDVVTMLSDATTAAAAIKTAGVLNYVVGFALPFGVNPAQLDTIAAAGGTGTAYNADNEAQLTSALNAVFNDILIRSGAAGAVALNSGSIQNNSRLFQAKFNTGDWSGQLQSFPIDPISGAVGAAGPDAGAVINTLNWDTGRSIITFNPVSGQGVPFRWPANPAAPTSAELSAAQVLALNTSPLSVVDAEGGLRLQYIRGNAAKEGTGGSDYRKRNVSKLGDIVNSSPVFVQKPSLNISDPTYVAFKNAHSGRADMVYVGANDGMLHGFLADTLVEIMAFVPSPVYARLSGLTAQGFSHKYMVDGSPVAADIQFTSGWKTILVGGLNGGGRGLYALDITDPSPAPAGAFRESNAGNTVLWEFTSSNDDDLGLTYSQASIIKLNNGDPGVVVGNGYNNTGSGHAVLFILNAQTGAVIRKIDTGSGSVGNPNGLSTPAVIDLDGNGTADYAYAGDLRGNVWKFDLTAGSEGSWSIAYGSPLFTARDGGGTRQPITSTLEVTRHPGGGLMVLFGTGRYIQSSDVPDTSTQTLYGIHDDGAVISGRSDLVQQAVTETQVKGGFTYRAVSTNAVDYTTKSGWYMDLPDAGERVVVDPILRNGKFIVPTTVPSASVCAVGGYSWLMELDYLGGGRTSKNNFDTNGDGVIDGLDDVPFTTNPGVASGMKQTAISSSASVVAGFGTDRSVENKYLNQSSGAIEQVRESGEPLANRRTSWRQIL